VNRVITFLIEPFRCVYLALREFQSVERRLESFSSEYRDEGASSSGIQSHSILEVFKVKYLSLISVILFFTVCFLPFSYYACVSRLICCFATIESVLKFFLLKLIH